MDSLQANVLQILSTQSEDFLARPDSSCFIAAGIEPAERVEECLNSLVELGYVEHNDIDIIVTVLKVERGEDGEPLRNEDDSFKPIFSVEMQPSKDDYGNNIEVEVKIPMMEDLTYLADSGWEITAEGQKAIEDLGS